MFKKVKELLESGAISKEVAENLDAEIQKELKALRDEASENRVKLKELQSTFNEVSDSKKSLEEQVAGLDEKIAKAKEDGKRELVADLEKEKAEKTELAEKLNSFEVANKNLRVENALSKELNKYDVIDAELLTDSFKSKLKVIENEVKFDEKTSLKDGMKQYFETRPHLLKAKGNAGSGAENAQGGFSKDSLTTKILARKK